MFQESSIGTLEFREYIPEKEGVHLKYTLAISTSLPAVKNRKSVIYKYFEIIEKHRNF